MREPAPEDRGGSAGTTVAEEPEIGPPATTGEDDDEFSTARSLLKYAGSWVGDDADDLLAAVSMEGTMDEPTPDEQARSASVAVTDPPPDETPITPVDPDFSTARALLKHVGTWVGDDWEELLAEVYATRGKTRF